MNLMPVQPPNPGPQRTWRPLVAVAAVLLVLTLAVVAVGCVFSRPALKGKSSDRTNVMIYGLTADGNRTDTMVLASYYWQEHKLVLLNIPRDLYAAYDGHDTKIVSLYAIARAERPRDQGYPAEYVNGFIEREYGIAVDYWVVANMKAFKELVDSVGGVTVNVQRPFTDALYPNDDYTGYLVPPPHFEAGVQVMDGTQALIYARSRHAVGPEGTDFARSKRQQILIKALLSKLRQQGVMTDLAKASTYLKIIRDNFVSNLEVGTILELAQTVGDLDPAKDVLMANWNNAIGFLCDSTDASGSYVLRYGTPDDCTAIAGVDSASPYRALALKYVQNLLESASGTRP